MQKKNKKCKKIKRIKNCKKNQKNAKKNLIIPNKVKYYKDGILIDWNK